MNKYTKVIYKSKAGSVVFFAPGDIWIESISGLETDVEIGTTQTVGQLGCTIDSQSVQPKTVTVNGCIVSNIESRRAQLLAVVLPLEPAKLIFEQDGESWYLQGFPRKTPALSDGLRPQHFQFQFFCPYPYLRTLNDKTYQLSGLSALWETPFTVGPHSISSYSAGAFVPVANSGSVPQAFLLDIYAAAEVVNPAVYNIEAGTHIKINKTLAPGEKFYISTHEEDKDRGSAYVYVDAQGNEHNGFRYITLDSDLSMRVAPGGSTFSLQAAEGSNVSNCRCKLITAGGEKHGI